MPYVPPYPRPRLYALARLDVAFREALAVRSAQIGGVFACHDHAGAASKCLAAAMAGLAVVLAGASWLLINTACQFSHTQVREGATHGQCVAWEQRRCPQSQFHIPPDEIDNVCTAPVQIITRLASNAHKRPSVRKK